MKLKTRLKEKSLSLLSGVLDRHVLLLPTAAADEAAILAVNAPYRVEDALLRARVEEPSRGELRVRVLAYEGHFPTNTLFTSRQLDYLGACELELDLRSGQLRLGTESVGTLSTPLPGRRFCVEFVWSNTTAHKRRITGHYIPADGVISSSYFEGDTYVDHEAQSAGEHSIVLRLLDDHPTPGTILEIGCATGGLLAALVATGRDALGVDVSEWAVARANERLSNERAWVCDLNTNEIPAELATRGPFGVLILWAVFEHFRDPFATLAKLAPHVQPGGLLLLNTTNADSLTHRLFDKQWEGYFDGSHFGVDKLSVQSLRDKLPAMGWVIDRLDTHLVWDGSTDPLHATVREWYAADARFRQLIAHTDRGDMITCVARRCA